MTDLWVDANACLPIRVTVMGDGPVDEGDPAYFQTVCWICSTEWPCAAYREGRLNSVQLLALPTPEEHP